MRKYCHWIGEVLPREWAALVHSALALPGNVAPLRTLPDVVLLPVPVLQNPVVVIFVLDSKEEVKRRYH